jgi:hypothetical protein
MRYSTWSRTNNKHLIIIVCRDVRILWWRSGGNLGPILLPCNISVHTHGEMGSAHKISTGNPKWKRPWHTWEDNINMGLTTSVWGYRVYSVWSEYGPVAATFNMVINLRIPLKARYFLTIFFQLASTVLIGPWPSLMDFSIHRHLVGLLGWWISPTQGLYRHTGQHNTETRRRTFMPRAGFEPAISMFKRS